MRMCFNCAADIPAETTHFVIQDKAYCTSCVEEKAYTAYAYYVDGEYVGSSEDNEARKVEHFEDDYESDDE